MINYYKCQYDLNAYVKKGPELENVFYSVTLCIEVDDDKNFLFNKFDLSLKEYFNRFYKKNLGDFLIFRGKKVSIETVGNALFEDIKKAAESTMIKIIQLEIFENPLCVYTVSERLLIPSRFAYDNQFRYKKIFERKQKYIHQVGA